MGHNLPKFGESGWGVSHTGTKEVEGVRREKQDGEEKKAKNRQNLGVEKKSKQIGTMVLGRIDPRPNQEGSGTRPFNHKYLRKGSTCPNTEHTQSYIGTSPEGLCA